MLFNNVGDMVDFAIEMAPQRGALDGLVGRDGMAEFEPTVFVVDDDEAIRKSLTRLIESAGLRVESFDSAEAYLQQYDPDRPGCLLTDVRMVDMSGLGLQQRLNELGDHLPVIMFTGYGDVPTAVRALREGAYDFLEKPLNGGELIDRIRKAISHDGDWRTRHAWVTEFERRKATLTPRELEVFELVVAGKTSGQIAAMLFRSEKTIKLHRVHIFKKFDVDSVMDLAKMALLANQHRHKS